MKPHLTLRDPCDVAAAVPYLLGFHPADGLVVLGLRGNAAVIVQRWELDADAEGLAEAVAGLVGDAVDGVLLVGYGDAYQVRAAVAALCVRLAPPVLCALRVAGDRCFCELCDGCTPPGGARFDDRGGRIAAEAVLAGLSALPSRADLAGLVAPVGGAAALAMEAAVARADVELGRARLRARSRQDPDGIETLVGQGRDAVDSALRTYRSGGRLDDAAVAHLTLLLHALPVRDHAWESTDHEEWQLSLWTDLTRRAYPSLVAPVASLLAFAAWRDGNGPLATVALERALAVTPAYGMANLLLDALLRGLPPDALGSWPAEAIRHASPTGGTAGGGRRL
ncbi:DUF4192 domain-containing protein [Hamadaea tsunoensis]|uniref:DUF4192 domain-containing protein n=1 Tax=Hamadaea tsunoensis TaxID=53368 RepID=UPI0004061B02|nr:DUF4192 domain-containing protein [Hamadaea tsunoensis]